MAVGAVPRGETGVEVVCAARRYAPSNASTAIKPNSLVCVMNASALAKPEVTKKVAGKRCAPRAIRSCLTRTRQTSWWTTRRVYTGRRF